MGRPWVTPAPRDWAPVPGRLELASVRACELESTTLLLWRKGEEGTGRLVAVPMRCKSYRCRRCSWLVAQHTYWRCERAVTARDRWLYAVLTFEHADFGSPWEAYKRAGWLWDHRLRRRLERRYGPIEYLQTWERHVRARPYPHANLLLRGEGLFAAVDALPQEWRWADRAAHGRGRKALWTAFRRPFRELAVASGFGRVLWAELIGEGAKPGLAAYLAKLAHELGAARLKAGDQTPIGAPAHFRRLRASSGLLPPAPKIRMIRRKNRRTGEEEWVPIRVDPNEVSDWTGAILPVPTAEFERRPPSWAVDFPAAMEYEENRRKAQLRRSLETCRK